MNGGPKRRDLEDRIFQFAESVRRFVKQLPRTITNAEDVRQLVRASGSASTRDDLAKEARELTLIFSAIISKSGGL